MLVRSFFVHIFTTLVPSPDLYELQSFWSCTHSSLSIADILLTTSVLMGGRGGAVVEALRYKPEGRGIDSLWYHSSFSLT
jgi:hypothetical protein